MSGPPTVITLPPIDISATPYPNTGLWGIRPIPEYEYVASAVPGELLITLINKVKADTAEIQKDFGIRTEQLDSLLDEEIQQTTGPLDDLTPHEAINRELQATRKLIEKTTTTQAAENKKSRIYFGQNPLKKNFADVIKVASRTRLYEQKLALWRASYLAAYNAKLLSEATKRLTAREKKLTTALANTESKAIEVQQKPATYSLKSSATAYPLVITPAATTMALFEGVLPALATALRTALPVLLNTAKVTPQGRAILLMLFLAKLENDERYGISVPLKDMASGKDIGKSASENTGKTIPIPARLVSDVAGENSRIFVVPTSKADISPNVRVRAAVWDQAVSAYRFTTDGPGPVTLLWTPAVTPGGSSTELPVDTTPKQPFPGFISVPAKPQILSFPDVGDFALDDYIVTFPADSGLEPVYVMFKSPRDYPGVASGDGQVVSGRWLEAASGEAGAAIPKQVADQLRGRAFATFGHMREAFWTAIANDPELSKSFNNSNISKMKGGEAPWPISREQVGGRRAFELHHILPISQGGAVYDLNNLTVMTPKRHIKIHSNRGS